MRSIGSRRWNTRCDGSFANPYPNRSSSKTPPRSHLPDSPTSMSNAQAAAHWPTMHSTEPYGSCTDRSGSKFRRLQTPSESPCHSNRHFAPSLPIRQSSNQQAPQQQTNPHPARRSRLAISPHSAWAYPLNHQAAFRFVQRRFAQHCKWPKSLFAMKQKAIRQQSRPNRSSRWAWRARQ